MDISEIIAANGLKIGRYRQLMQYMKVNEYLRSRSFLDLGPRSFTYENKKFVFLRNHWVSFNQILYVSF